MMDELVCKHEGDNPIPPPAVLREIKRHDEAMRMQALAIGVQFVCSGAAHVSGNGTPLEDATRVAQWAYREATGREW